METIIDMSDDLLRELADTRPEQGRVLSLYLDLDPAEFATADARASAVRSLLDGAGREIESIEDLSHDERQGSAGSRTTCTASTIRAAGRRRAISAASTRT